MLSATLEAARRSRRLPVLLAVILVASGLPRPAHAADAPYVIEVAPEAAAAKGTAPAGKAPAPIIEAPGLVDATQAVLGQGYLPETEPNNSTATATFVPSSNSLFRGTLWPNGDVDFYRFDAEIGDRVYIATMMMGSAGSSQDSQLTVLDQNGTTVLEFDDDNGSFGQGFSSSIAGVPIPATGTYFIRVNDFTAGTASERPYELHFRLQDAGTPPMAETEPNNTTATANALPVHGWVSGTRDPAGAVGVGDADFFSLTLQAGESVHLQLDLDPERDGVTWNGRLGFGLFGDTTNQILVVDDAGASEAPNPTIPSEAMFFTVQTTGTYFAYVDSAGAAVGGPTATYRLSVTVHPVNNEGVNCTTYASTDVPKTIGPDPSLTSSVIVVPGNPRIQDVDVTVVLNHPFISDIDAHLRTPAGNDNGLFTDIGNGAVGGQAQMDATFDDEAALIPAFTTLRGVQVKPDNAPVNNLAAGHYRLSWLDGENAGGTWTLDLRDDFTGDGGTLTAWSIRICEPFPPPACPVGMVPVTVFSTDFESGAAGFTHSGTQDEWELGLPATVATTTTNPVAPFNTCASGTSCWKTDLDNTYNASSNQDLLSPSINLAGFSAPVVVRWSQRHQVETATNDHMFVDAQQVGGATPVRLYEWLDGTPISATAGTGNPQVNIGASAGWGLQSRRADSLAGLNSELRFHLDSNATVNFGGLAIDDVSVTACRAPVADLSITKTDGVTTATPGGSVTYTITASNAGPDAVTGGTVADTFPATLTCTWTCVGAGGGTCTAAGAGNVNDTVNLPAGGSATYTASCSISASASGSLSNTATVSSAVPDPTPGNNSATDTDTLTPNADLAITKTDGVTTATPGGSTTYTITASNPGPSNAPGSTVADTFPATLTCTWTCVGAGGGTCTAAGAGNINDTVNLPAGGSVTYTASCNIDPDAAVSISNTATVSSSVTDPNPANNSATDTDFMTPSADLAITKTDGVTTALPGGSTTYTITASNAGPSNSPLVIVTDTFPASLTCNWTCAGAGGGTCTASGVGNLTDPVMLPSGGSATYTATCSISASATGSLVNTATVSTVVTDPNPANNSATDTDTLAGRADVAVTKTVDNATPTVGSNVTYTVSANNDGPSDAHSVVVTDLLPNGLTFVSSTPSAGTYTAATGAWAIGTLADGGSATLAITATVTSSQAIVNQASVTAQAETDPNRSNNTGIVAINAPGLADVQLRETVDDTTPGNPQDVTFTVSAHNAGPTSATNVVVTDNLPTGLTFVSATPSQGTYTPGTGAWNVGTIASGATPTLTVVATVTTASPIFRVVQKTQNEPDYASDNDTDSVSLNDATVADLAMSLVASQEPVPQGTTFTYTIVVSNHGPATATNVTVTDALPPDLTFVSATPTQGSCTGTTNVSCNLGALADGNSASIALVVTKTVGGSVSNTASVTATEADPFMPNNSNSETSTPAELTTFRVE
jgi:uncharacterized repeat protein (TIGR01451 family)